ncbi:hypothetical protein SNEBB_009605, partial [Seison nebaliae]
MRVESVEICEDMDDEEFEINGIDGITIKNGAVLILYQFGVEQHWMEWDDEVGGDLLIIQYIFKRIGVTLKVNGLTCVLPQELEELHDRIVCERKSFDRINGGNKLLYIWKTGIGRFHVNAIWRDGNELHVFEPVKTCSELGSMVE